MWPYVCVGGAWAEFSGRGMGVCSSSIASARVTTAHAKSETLWFRVDRECVSEEQYSFPLRHSGTPTWLAIEERVWSWKLYVGLWIATSREARQVSPVDQSTVLHYRETSSRTPRATVPLGFSSLVGWASWEVDSLKYSGKHLTRTIIGNLRFGDN